MLINADMFTFPELSLSAINRIQNSEFNNTYYNNTYCWIIPQENLVILHCIFIFFLLLFLFFWTCILLFLFAQIKLDLTSFLFKSYQQDNPEGLMRCNNTPSSMNSCASLNSTSMVCFIFSLVFWENFGWVSSYCSCGPVMSVSV